MPLHLVLIILGIALILISAIYTIGYHVKKTLPSSIVGLIWDIEDDWFLLHKDGSKIKAALDGNSFIHPLFSVLNFKQENKLFSRSVILLPDNIDKNDFRRLRVRLKVTNLQEVPE